MSHTVDDKAFYAKTHEWARRDGGEIVVGVSDYAQQKLSDIVFVDLPAVGKTVAKGAPFAVIESVKAAEDVFSPVSGTVAAVNEALVKSPELVNKDPFGGGWLVRIRPSAESAAFESGGGLMGAADYRTYVDAL